MFDALKEKSKVLEDEYQSMLDESEFIDISAKNINVLIRYNKKNYIVFVDKELELDWATTDLYDEDEYNANIRSERHQYLNSLEILQHSPTLSYLSDKKKLEFIRLLGEAWAHALDGNFELSQLTINEAITYLQKRNYEISRSWQLVGSFILTFVAVFFFLASKWNMYLLYGCIGALFSIICKIGNVDYDCEAGIFLNILEIISRFVASIISAYIVVQLFDLNLIFSAFKTSNQPDVAVTLLCFVAGFSERLVPSLISRIEKTEQKEVEKND